MSTPNRGLAPTSKSWNGCTNLCQPRFYAEIPAIELKLKCILDQFGYIDVLVRESDLPARTAPQFNDKRRLGNLLVCEVNGPEEFGECPLIWEDRK